MRGSGGLAAVVLGGLLVFSGTLHVGDVAARQRVVAAPEAPAPGHTPRFVTQTDERPPWEDCLWASGVMLLDKWTRWSSHAGSPGAAARVGRPRRRLALRRPRPRDQPTLRLAAQVLARWWRAADLERPARAPFHRRRRGHRGRLRPARRAVHALGARLCPRPERRRPRAVCRALRQGQQSNLVDGPAGPRRLCRGVGASFARARLHLEAPRVRLRHAHGRSATSFRDAGTCPET